MTKKEIKTAQAQFHAFIKSQQKSAMETNITFMDGEEERNIPVKIKLQLNAEEQIMFVNRVVDFCRDGDTGEIYPSSFKLGFDIALMEYFTDIKERIKADDIIAFLTCFDIEEFLDRETHEEIDFYELMNMCSSELRWAQEQYLNTQGVNGVFIKLNNLVDKIDIALDSANEYAGENKIDMLLEAVKTVAEAPEKVSEKIIEMEHARVAKIKTETE